MIFKWFIIIFLKTFRVSKLQVKLYIRRFIFMVQYYAVRLHQCCGNFASLNRHTKLLNLISQKEIISCKLLWLGQISSLPIYEILIDLNNVLWNLIVIKRSIFSHSKSFVLTSDLVETCISLYTLPMIVKAYDFAFAFST